METQKDMKTEEILQYCHPDGSVLFEQTVKGVHGFETQRTKEKLAEEYGIKTWEIKVKRKDSKGSDS